MGGAGALLHALRHADRFACAAAHSAALHPADPDDMPEWAQEGFRSGVDFHGQYGYPIDRAQWQTNNVLYQAEHVARPDTGSLRLYFDAGVEDHLGFHRTNARLSQILAARGVPHLFALRPGGHGDGFTADHLPESLRFIGAFL